MHVTIMKEEEITESVMLLLSSSCFFLSLQKKFLETHYFLNFVSCNHIKHVYPSGILVICVWRDIKLYFNQRFSMILENPSILGSNIDLITLITLSDLHLHHKDKTRQWSYLTIIFVCIEHQLIVTNGWKQKMCSTLWTVFIPLTWNKVLQNLIKH